MGTPHWADTVVDDAPDEDQELRSDDDVLGDVRGSSRRHRMSGAGTSGCIQFEHQWEPDIDAFRPGQVRFALYALFFLN